MITVYVIVRHTVIKQFTFNPLEFTKLKLLLFYVAICTTKCSRLFPFILLFNLPISLRCGLFFFLFHSRLQHLIAIWFSGTQVTHIWCTLCVCVCMYAYSQGCGNFTTMFNVIFMLSDDRDFVYWIPLLLHHSIFHEQKLIVF